MQISLENTSALERRLTVTIPEEAIVDKVKSRLDELVRTVKVDGFRKGKVPMSVVTQRFGPQARDEVVNELLQSSFSEALGKEDLRPAGQPKIDEVATAKGQGLKYCALFEVFPAIEPAELSGIKITKASCEIQDNDLETVISQLRDHHKVWSEVDRPSQDGDQLAIDFKGSIGGEVFEGGTGSDFEVSLGSGTMIEGFESGLIGQSKGDKPVLDLKFPEEYQNKPLAGKDVTFEIEIKKISESELPELDEVFFEKFGVKEGGEAAFRKQVRENMEKESKKAQAVKFRNEVMEKVMEVNTFDVPEALILDEIGRQKQQMAQDMMMRGLNPAEESEEFDKLVRERASGSVKMGLLMAEIIKRHELKAEPGKVKEMIENMSAGYEDSEAVTKWYYDNPEHMKQIEGACLEEAVVDWLASQAEVVDETISFDALMNPVQTTI
jgi:trigger factor